MTLEERFLPALDLQKKVYSFPGHPVSAVVDRKCVPSVFRGYEVGTGVSGGFFDQSGVFRPNGTAPCSLKKSQRTADLREFAASRLYGIMVGLQERFGHRVMTTCHSPLSGEVAATIGNKRSGLEKIWVLFSCFRKESLVQRADRSGEAEHGSGVEFAGPGQGQSSSQAIAQQGHRASVSVEGGESESEGTHPVFQPTGTHPRETLAVAGEKGGQHLEALGGQCHA